MYIRILIITLLGLCTSPMWAFTCYYTLAKDSCWINYNVTVDVIDATTSNVVTTVTVPSGKSWTRQVFTCQPAQKLMYQARFTPSFWETEKGKVYPAQNYWSLPTAVNPGDTAWNISVCYPSAFSEVPLPPDATGNCHCDLTVIPAIKPQ